VGRQLSRDSAVLEAELGTGRPDVLLPFRDQAGGLHDEHDRIFEHDTAEGKQESAAVPKRRGGLQADVLGPAQHLQEVDNAYPELERGSESVRYPVRRQGTNWRPQLRLTYTDCLELPHNLGLVHGLHRLKSIFATLVASKLLIDDVERACVKILKCAIGFHRVNDEDVILLLKDTGR